MRHAVLAALACAFFGCAGGAPERPPERLTRAPIGGARGESYLCEPTEPLESLDVQTAYWHLECLHEKGLFENEEVSARVFVGVHPDDITLALRHAYVLDLLGRHDEALKVLVPWLERTDEIEGIDEILLYNNIAWSSLWAPNELGVKRTYELALESTRRHDSKFCAHAHTLVLATLVVELGDTEPLDATDIARNLGVWRECEWSTLERYDASERFSGYLAEKMLVARRIDGAYEGARVLREMLDLHAREVIEERPDASSEAICEEAMPVARARAACVAELELRRVSR